MSETGTAAGNGAEKIDLDSVEMITSDARFGELCAVLRDEAVVGLDTEFVRTRTFFPQLGLIQIAWKDEIALVDSLAITDWEPFANVLLRSDAIKVLHSPSEDLEVFYQLVGGFPEPLFDTQVAATLAGHGASLGYQRLVSELRGIDIPKGQQRSNWLQRPLTGSQIRYAALDVVYLLGIAEELGREVESRDRWGWLREEMSAAIRAAGERLRPEVQFRRLARFGMRAQEFQVLFLANAWRERTARERDRPRRFIVADEVLQQLAKERPKSKRQLGRIKLLDDKKLRRFGDELLEIVEEAGTVAPEQYEAWLPQAPLKGAKSTEHRTLLGRVRDTLEAVGRGLDLPADFLLTRKQVDRLIECARRDGDWPSCLDGWRAEVLVEPLTAVLG